MLKSALSESLREIVAAQNALGHLRHVLGDQPRASFAGKLIAVDGVTIPTRFAIPEGEQTGASE